MAMVSGSSPAPDKRARIEIDAFKGIFKSATQSREPCWANCGSGEAGTTAIAEDVRPTREGRRKAEALIFWISKTASETMDSSEGLFQVKRSREPLFVASGVRKSAQGSASRLMTSENPQTLSITCCRTLSSQVGRFPTSILSVYHRERLERNIWHPKSRTRGYARVHHTVSWIVPPVTNDRVDGGAL